MGFPSSRSRRRFPRCRSRGREEIELFPVWHERFREPLNLPKPTDSLSAAWQKVSKRTFRIALRTLLIEPSIPPTGVWLFDLGNYVTPWRQEVVPGRSYGSPGSPITFSKMLIGVRAAKRGLPPIPAFGIGWLYPVCPRRANLAIPSPQTGPGRRQCFTRAEERRERK